MTEKNISYYITSFFTDYIPKQRALSPNTVKSYRDTIILLLRYYQSEHHICPEKLNYELFSITYLEGFLKWLEETRGNSVSTRNQRLAAIHSFFEYIQYKDLEAFNMCKEVLTVPFKKGNTIPMNYLSLEEIKILLSIPDQKSKTGLRDMAMLTLLYETAARVQELIDLTPSSIQKKSTITVELHGKGGKTRFVPLNNEAYGIVKNYMVRFGISDSHHPLFFNSADEKLTRQGVQYVLDKYISKAHDSTPSLFKKRITNHSLRHSKAMHLLEAGVNLVYIRDFLGHESVTTTEIYAKVNPKIKEKMLIENSSTLETRKRYTDKQKEDLVQWLRDNL